MKEITKGKELWKKGEITFEEIQNILSSSSSSTHTNNRVPSLEKGRSSQAKQNENQKAMKEFESYGKAERKKISNYIDSDSNKFRIVTEPVDDRIMHFKNSNLFSSSLAMKNPKKIETEVR